MTTDKMNLCNRIRNNFLHKAFTLLTDIKFVFLLCLFNCGQIIK